MIIVKINYSPTKTSPRIKNWQLWDLNIKTPCSCLPQSKGLDCDDPNIQRVTMLLWGAQDRERLIWSTRVRSLLCILKQYDFFPWGVTTLKWIFTNENLPSIFPILTTFLYPCSFPPPIYAKEFFLRRKFQVYVCLLFNYFIASFIMRHSSRKDSLRERVQMQFPLRAPL